MALGNGLASNGGTIVASPIAIGSSLIDIPPASGMPVGLTSQGFLQQHYPQGWISSGGIVTGVGNTIAAGVSVSAITGWIPSTTGNGYLTTPSGTYTNLPNGGSGADSILYWTGTGYARQTIGVGYPAPTVAGQVQLARITTVNGVITAITPIQQMHWRPSQSGEINVISLGADPTGVTDSTAAFQLALNVAARGDGTNRIRVPAGRYLILGQLRFTGFQRAGVSTFNMAHGVHIVGSPSGGIHQSRLEGGTILDLRWDGGINSATGATFTNDWAAIQGFHWLGTAVMPSGNVPWTTQTQVTWTNVQIGKGNDVANRAYINNTTSTDLKTVPDSGTIVIPPALYSASSQYATVYFLDADAGGNIYANPNGQITDTTVNDPGASTRSTPISGGGSNCGQSTTPNCIRLYSILVDSTGNITQYTDLRPTTGKIELSPFATMLIDNISFTSAWYGQWDGATAYSAGQIVYRFSEAYRVKSTVVGTTQLDPVSTAGAAVWERLVTNPTSMTLPTGAVWYRDQVPFIHITGTNFHFTNCSFVGPIPAGPRGPAAIDAISVGGPGTPRLLASTGTGVSSGFDGISVGAQFSGYGSTVLNCSFDNSRRCLRGLTMQQTRFTGNYIQASCGGGDQEGAYALDGPSLLMGANGNVFSDNIHETIYYPYGARFGTSSHGNTVSGGSYTDTWSGSVAATPSAGQTTLSVNSLVNQDNDITCWYGQQLSLGAINGSGVSAPLTPEIVTISTATPMTGTNVATVVSQPDFATLVLSADLGAAPVVLLETTVASQEIATLSKVTASTDISGNTLTGGTVYRTARALRYQHSAGTNVATGPWTVTLTQALQRNHVNGDLLSRSIAPIRLVNAQYVGVSKFPYGAVGISIIGMGDFSFPVLDENGSNTTNTVLQGAFAYNYGTNITANNVNLVNTIPTNLTILGTLFATTLAGSGAGITGLAATNFVNTIAANTALLGPNGSSGIPSFRSIVNADLPANLTPASVISTTTQTSSTLNPPAPFSSTFNSAVIASNTAITTRADLQITQGTQNKVAMQFVAGFTATSGQVQLSLHKDSALPPRGNDVIAVQIWSDSGNLPNVQLATMNMLVAGIGPGGAGSNTYTTYWIGVLSTALTGGTKYWLVLDGTSMLAGSIVYSQYDSSGASLVATWNGAAWSSSVGTGYFSVNATYSTATLTATNNSSASGISLAVQTGDGVAATTTIGRAGVFTSTFGAAFVATSISNNAINTFSTYGSALSANQTAQISSLLNTSLASLKRQVTVPASTTFNANSPLLDINDANVSAAAATSGVGTSTGLLSRWTKNNLVGLSLDQNFNFIWTVIPAPGAPTVGAFTLGGTLSESVGHTWAYTAVNANGETTIGTSTGSFTPSGGNDTANLTIPIASGGCTSRKIYRNDGSGMGLVGTINDNSMTTFVDTGVALGAAPPTVNGTGGQTTIAGKMTFNDGINLAFGTTTGTKIGTAGGAAGQKLGFFNQTPIVQPLLATGSAHTVDDVITTLQNLGLCRQS